MNEDDHDTRDQDEDLKAQGDYEVGYGKPPKKHRFRKGTSGNAKGRPKGARGLRTELREELFEKVTITEGGRQRKVSKLRLTLKSLTAKAAKGDVRAADRLLRLIMEVLGIDDERDVKKALSASDEAILNQFMGDFIDREVDDGT